MGGVYCSRLERANTGLSKLARLHGMCWPVMFKNRVPLALIQGYLRDVHQLCVYAIPTASGYACIIDKTDGTGVQGSDSFDFIYGTNAGGRFDKHEDALSWGLTYCFTNILR